MRLDHVARSAARAHGTAQEDVVGEDEIGRAVRAIARSYVVAYSAAKGVAPPAPVGRGVTA